MKTSSSILVFLALISTAFDVLANEGRIVFVEDGAARLIRPNTAPVEAKLGDTFGAGASLVTAGGRAHVRFADGALLSLQPNTVFVMNEYIFNGRNDGAEQFAGNLIKGGLRMVTGLIGKRESRVFKIEGVVATVGIRGTAFKMEYCNKDCGGKADGLYVDGGEGTTVVSNAAGSLNLTRGSSAFVANRSSAPEQTTQRTSVATPAPTSPARDIGATREEQRFADYSFKTGNLVGPFRTVSVTQGGIAVAFTNNVIGSGKISSGAGEASAGQSGYGVLDASDRALAIGASGKNGDAFFVTTNNVENAGGDGLLYWGRWANGQVDANFTSVTNGKSGAGTGNLSGVQSVHYIVSQMASAIPISGTASYSFFAGTPSTSNDGVLGSGVTSGTLNVNFGSSSGNLNMSVGHGGATLSQNGTFTLNSGYRAAFTGSGNGSFPFTFDGFFAGGNRADANPARAGISYLIQRPGNYISGVAGFK